MTVSNISLRPIRELQFHEKAQLPVSLVRGDDGQEIIVSRYADDIWDFWPYIPQGNRKLSSKSIDWHVNLEHGTKLTDPEHAALLAGAKDFIWSLFNEPIEGRQRPFMGTIVGHFISLIPLLRWMVTRNIRHFRDLRGKAIEYVSVARISEKTGKPVATGWHARRLMTLEDIYLQREKLADALDEHPWPDESASALAGETFKGRSTKTPRIPEQTVRHLARIAVDYVDQQATRLLDARDTIAHEVNGASGYLATNIRIPLARDLGFDGSRDFSNELALLRDACYIVIAMFSGIRDSETLSLNHSCISHSTTDDGIDLTWLHGTIYKTGQRAHKWLVPPVVEAAVRVMERYRLPFASEIERQIAEFERRVAMTIPHSHAHKMLVKCLQIARRDRNSLFLGTTPHRGHTTNVVSGALINRRLKHFCEHFGILGENGKPWLLCTHQFRRTYAYFVASAELGDLHYLREHFGHWSIDMTLLYADGATDEFNTDSDLLLEILRSKAEKQEDVFRNYLLTDLPLANGDIMLSDLRRTIKTARNKDELIKQVSDGVTLNGTGHSWCIGNAKGTGCGGLCVFEADMCVDCSYGMIGPEHLSVWKEISRQQQEALAMPDMGISGKARSERILAKANNVIAKLEAT
ncbi:hypothetical protein [Methylobacter tundripaludum]|uniref:Integrase family protein n=1 Tax=Methylobacter tundripaludum (strain ATCC BAA-1195 / DSM 17260 / SV96) TaxID=697282 RepID=G3IUI0_METTV|nr:hypothetical protein [Methylobacter tundripaludum]EGW21590.1 integrase family protein [Methylobacter tundripaludum SV96]